MSISEPLFAVLETGKTMQVMQKHYREGDACRDNLAECVLQLKRFVMHSTVLRWPGCAAQLSGDLGTLRLTMMQIIDFSMYSSFLVRIETFYPLIQTQFTSFTDI